MKLSRRLTAGVAAAAASVLVLVGCGSPTSSTGDGKVLKWGQTNSIAKWDPVVTGATGATLYLTPIFEPLLTQDENGQPAPALAESWEYNADGTAVTFTLRPGLTFHDDSPVDADAVAYYINRAINQEDSALKGSYSNIENATVDSELDFTVNLKSVDYQIPYLLSLRAGLVTSKAATESDPEGFNTRNPVGAGPFRVVELVPESHIYLEKFDGYWDADNIHIDRIELQFGNDASTLVSGVQTGVYNFVTLPPAQVQRARDAGLDIVSDVSKNWYSVFLSVNNNLEPFQDPRVVEAVRLAINSQEFVDKVTLGEGATATQPVPKGHPLYNSSLEKAVEYNPERARQLLAEAGYPNGFDITLETAATSADAEAEVVQSQLGAVGITATINKDPNWSKGYFAKEQALALYRYVGRNSHAQTLTEHYDVGGVLNLSSPYSSPEFQEALAVLRATPIDDPEYPARARAAAEAGYLGGTTISLYTIPLLWGKSKDISSNFVNPEGVLSWKGITIGEDNEQ